MSVVEKVLEKSEQFFFDKKVQDIVVGVSLIAVQLSDGSLGISYVLRDSLPSGCSIFPYAKEVPGKTVKETAEWILTGKENLQKAIGGAILCAALEDTGVPDEEKSETPYGININADDKVGMIGFIPPVADMFMKHAGSLIVFDQGISLRGGGERGCDAKVMPMEKQQEMLPDRDIVVLSGTTTVNGTIDGLLEICKKAREIIMIGPSTPMCPEGFKGSGITRLAGSFWDRSHKEDIFKNISQAGGIAHVKKYMIKKSANVM